MFEIEKIDLIFGPREIQMIEKNGHQFLFPIFMVPIRYSSEFGPLVQM